MARAKTGQFLPGHDVRRQAKALTDGLWRALAEDDWHDFRKGCKAISRQFAEGQPAAQRLVWERIEGPVMPQLDAADRAFSITWSFGPTAIDHADAHTVRSDDQALLDAPAPAARGDDSTG